MALADHSRSPRAGNLPSPPAPEGYTTIIGALDRARAITQRIDDDYAEDPHGKDASPANRKAQGQMVKFFCAAWEAFHANKLMLSKAFIAKYDKMNRSLVESNNPNLALPEIADIAARVMERIVPEVEELAARELSVSP